MALMQLDFDADDAYERTVQFSLWANHLRHLYFRMLNQFDAGRVKKILIIVHQGKSEEYTTTGKSDITSGTWHFDFNKFWDAEEKVRQRMVLDRIRDSLLEIAKVQGWDVRPFKDAHKKVVDANFLNEEVGNKPIKSPDGKWRARWHYVYGPDKIVFSVALESADQEASRTIPFFSTEPIDAYLNGVLGKVKWLSDTRVALLAKDGTQQGVVDISKPSSKPKKKK